MSALTHNLPLGVIVLEFDSSDIPPVCRGRDRNAKLPRITAQLATLRGVSVEHIAAQTTHNAKALFSPD